MEAPHHNQTCVEWGAFRLRSTHALMGAAVWVIREELRGALAGRGGGAGGVGDRGYIGRLEKPC